MICPVCNNECNENDVFCKNCGTPFTTKQRALNTFKPDKLIRPLKMWEYFLLILIWLIPIVNIVTFLVLSFKNDTNINYRNFSRASLVWILFSIVAAAVLITILYIYTNFDFLRFMNEIL